MGGIKGLLQGPPLGRYDVSLDIHGISGNRFLQDGCEVVAPVFFEEPADTCLKKNSLCKGELFVILGVVEGREAWSPRGGEY